jgi:hypothetical protein
MPVKYPADGQTRVYWIPGEDGIADKSAPTEAELNAGIDISCHIQSGGLALGISTATIEAASLCSYIVSNYIGRTTVAPTITAWRYKQPDDEMWDLVENGAIGWLAIRTGMDYETAWADGQDVTTMLLQMSEPQPTFEGGDTLNTFTVTLGLINGDEFDQKANVGGVS